MRSCQLLGMRILVLYALVVMASNVVWARSAALSLALPLTPQEEATRLRSLASPEVARRLHLSGAGAVNTIRPMPFYQRNYRREWLEGPLEDRINRRRNLAEKIGEQGRARLAAEQGWIKLLGSQNRGVPQGPDAVYFDPRSGRLLAVESKGNTSRLRWSSTFNSRQGTNQYSLRSAKNIFARYRKAATPEMKIQMARLILSAEKRQLDTVVIRTTAALGKPNAPELVSRVSENVALEARRVRRELIKTDPAAREYFRLARRKHWQARMAFRVTHPTFGLGHGATQGMRALGFAGTLGLGWDSYQQFAMAWSMIQDPALKGNALPYMQTGVAVGRMAQATTLGMGSTGPLGVLKLSARRGIGIFAGRAFLPITVGVEGLQLATTYRQYGLGRISQREFYRRSAGPVVTAVFVTGGATIGGIVGFTAVGVGAIPGAMAGAKVGAFAAIPVQFATDYMVGWYYRKFDEQQLRTVNAAIETFYGLEAHHNAVQN